MEQNTKDILETVNFIKDRMLTKDDVRDITREVIRQEVPAMIREELKPLHHELREINRRLDALDSRPVASVGSERWCKSTIIRAVRQSSDPLRPRATRLRLDKHEPVFVWQS